MRIRWRLRMAAAQREVWTGTQLRRLLAEKAGLDARRRAAVHHLVAVMGLSERFACQVTGQHRTTQRHQPASATSVDPGSVRL